MLWLALSISTLLGSAAGFVRYLSRQSNLAANLIAGGLIGLFIGSTTFLLTTDDEMAYRLICIEAVLLLVAVKLEALATDFKADFEEWMNDPDRPRYRVPDSDPPSPRP